RMRGRLRRSSDFHLLSGHLSPVGTLFLLFSRIISCTHRRQATAQELSRSTHKNMRARASPDGFWRYAPRNVVMQSPVFLEPDQNSQETSFSGEYWQKRPVRIALLRWRPRAEFCLAMRTMLSRMQFVTALRIRSLWSSSLRGRPFSP